MNLPSSGRDRLYQDLARSLLASISSGQYPVGSRMPAERELALQYEVSRPTVREAIIALEVQGIVEVRVGSGAYVLRLPGKTEVPGFNVTAIEITEARLLFEAEAAALAAMQISSEELAGIEQLVAEIAQENLDSKGTESADRRFHLAVAKATRNAAIYDAVEHLWDLRESSPESALLHAKARSANIKPVVDEHSAVLAALHARDPSAARNAMRAHLSAVLESLLFATEELAVEEARRAFRAKRDHHERLRA
jgi:GntR family transcriptional repressor for pyruvate dehydrogenase complex